MNDLIRRLRAFGIECNPPASAKHIKALEADLNAPLPAELRALYCDHNGMADARGTLPFRLLSLDEVRQERETLDLFLETFEWSDRGLVLFFTNDNSDYAGVYLSGPMAGRVAVVPHEGVDVAPRYRSVQSFLQALLAAAEGGEDDLRDLVFEYTPEATFSPEERRQDRDAAQALWPLYQAARKEDRATGDLVACILALTPPEQTDSLLALLDDADRESVSRTMRLLGQRRWEAAVPHLARHTELDRQYFCCSNAINALGEIATPACKEALCQAATRLPAASFGHCIGEALARCCEYRYRKERFE
jgi:SMI1 / KNR4 family (SUKH-1)